MAEQFLPDDGNVLSFPDTSWLGDAGVEAQIGRDSYGVDEFLIYSSDNPPYPLKADHFQPELPFPFRNTGPEVLDRAADKEISYWGPLEMPSSIPSSLNPSLVSTSLENRDFDMTEMSVLSQPVLMLADAEPPKACSPRCLDRLDISTSTILPVVGSRPLLVSACQQSSIMESHLPNITLKRKRSSERVTADGPNSNLIDRESALKLCVKHIPDPTIGVIESVAKDFGFSFEFVMDLCCRYRKNRNSSSLNFAKLENAQRSSSVYGESEKLAFSTEDASRRGITIGEPTVTTPPTKRPKLSIEIQKENGKALQTKSDRCHVCGQTFSRHPDLLRHQKSHSPAQIHCPYPGCMKSFTRKDKFNEHWRRRHSGDMSQTNLIQDGEDEHRRDPDPGGSQGSGNSFGPGGPGQGGTSFQKSQNGEASANQSLPSYGSSSGTSFNLEIDLVESFYPAFANQAVNDYVRKFAAAKVIRKLGRGGFGSVYEVFVDSGLDATHCNVFACKTLSLPRRGRQEITERAKNEINILQLLDHPHIIKFSGALILRDRIFINSQPLADSDLKVFLAEQSLPIPTLTKSQIWEGARGLASALAYVHDYGKGNGYHGDLKPENILVIREAKPSPSIKFLLADFGSAWISNSTSIINPHNRAGTPRYCAPEYFTSQSAIGPFSDVWSLGCVFAVIVTFLHDQTMGDFECFQQCNMEPEEKWTYTERLPALKVWLQFLSLYRRQFAFPIIQLEHMNLIQKMLLPDPEDRPSATKVIRRLKAIENSTMDSVDECNQQSDWTSKQPSSVTSLSGSSLLNNKRRRRSKLEPPTKLILHVLSWGFRASDQALKEKCWEWTDEKSLKMWCISVSYN
jgi:serine/threonine protein kinase